MFWMATGYLTLNDHVVTEKLLLHFRGVKQLACIKHRKQLRRMIKTSEEETLISEAQWEKKGLCLLWGIKIGQRSRGLMSPDLSSSRMISGSGR